MLAFFLVAALVARLTARDDHVAVRTLPNRYALWACGAVVGAVLGMIASIVFFNLGPIPFSFGQAGQQVSGSLRTTDNSVLISATATLIGLAVAIVVVIEAVWCVVASRRRQG
ncbi:hypothetical protein [Fodinicola feengrottensis]|uniref:hypothetical protein n=1 Tax=Fodinicola feengrottensis TaxID=435914 RepID=UPI002441C7C4|nr:hypothetical protein [Fodinicola feengrottensis]